MPASGTTRKKTEVILFVVTAVSRHSQWRFDKRIARVTPHISPVVVLDIPPSIVLSPYSAVVHMVFQQQADTELANWRVVVDRYWVTALINSQIGRHLEVWRNGSGRGESFDTRTNVVKAFRSRSKSLDSKSSSIVSNVVDKYDELKLIRQLLIRARRLDKSLSKQDAEFRIKELLEITNSVIANIPAETPTTHIDSWKRFHRLLAMMQYAIPNAYPDKDNLPAGTDKSKRYSAAVARAKKQAIRGIDRKVRGHQNYRFWRNAVLNELGRIKGDKHKRRV